MRAPDTPQAQLGIRNPPRQSQQLGSHFRAGNRMRQRLDLLVCARLIVRRRGQSVTQCVKSGSGFSRLSAWSGASRRVSAIGPYLSIVCDHRFGLGSVLSLTLRVRPDPGPTLPADPSGQYIGRARRQFMEFPFDYFLARAPHQLRPARAPPLDLPQNLIAPPGKALVTLVEAIKFGRFRRITIPNRHRPSRAQPERAIPLRA